MHEQNDFKRKPISYANEDPMHTHLYNTSITKYIYTCLVYKCTCTCTCCTHNYRVHFTSLKKTRSEREIHTFLETKVFKIYFSLITFKGTGTCTDLGRLGEGGADYFPPGKLYFHILCKPPPPNALDPTPPGKLRYFLDPLPWERFSGPVHDVLIDF